MSINLQILLFLWIGKLIASSVFCSFVKFPRSWALAGLKGKKSCYRFSRDLTAPLTWWYLVARSVPRRVERWPRTIWYPQVIMFTVPCRCLGHWGRRACASCPATSHPRALAYPRPSVRTARSAYEQPPPPGLAVARRRLLTVHLPYRATDSWLCITYREIQARRLTLKLFLTTSKMFDCIHFCLYVHRLPRRLWSDYEISFVKGFTVVVVSFSPGQDMMTRGHHGYRRNSLHKFW